MKIVKLSKEEQEVILTALNERKICEAYCYCGYRAEGMCDKETKDGKPVCRLKQIIESIGEKLS